MLANELRRKFIEFFISKGHKQIPSASLVPENDPTVLFTTAGMHPLVPYLTGQPHSLGKRLCSVQKCLRTDDIEEVGDLRHFTFFEMLGNWSLGDYFKKKAIEYSFEFLTDKQWLGLDPNKIYISVFEGDKDAPKDEESIKVWQRTFTKVGIKATVGDWRNPYLDKGERIFSYDKKKNWWGPAGKTGPCGPDTEMFYDTGLPHDKKFGKHCHPNCDCGRFVEIWNDVFMEFNKKLTGKGQEKLDKALELTPEDFHFELLKQKNVDTGLGLERIVAIIEFLEGKINIPDPFQTNLFRELREEIIDKVKGEITSIRKQRIRIFLDHSRAAVFLIGAGITPGKNDRESILRRLIRRADDQLDILFQLNKEYKRNIWERAVYFYSKNYSSYYKELIDYRVIFTTILEELDRYRQVVTKTATIAAKAFISKKISGEEAFKLFTTYGFSPEQMKEKGYIFNKEEFNKAMERHKEISRRGIKQKFAGGLQDHSEQTTKLHTATHLLHAALRQVLGTHVQQVGSNITAERLRFDFIHPKPLTQEELSTIENLVNEQIKKNFKVTMEIMPLEEAKKQGALAFFGQKYPEKVKVYTIDGFSKEVCGGPHVDFTGSIGEFRIKKEESSGAGKRRIYAVVASNAIT